MRRPSLTSLTLLAVLWTTPVAYAQVDAQIAELNGQALEAYQALDIDTARGKLEQAIGLAQQSGVGGPVVAQSYMSLGVVYVAGMNDRDQGLTAFVSAVCMQPDVQLDPLLSTPDVQQVFVQAQQDAQGGACGPGAAMAPPVQGGMPQQGYPSPADAAASGYGGPRSDVECPPGVICDAAGAGEAKGPSNFARGFFNLQLAVGSSLVGQGMKADSKPKNWMSEVYQPAMLVPFDSNGDGMIDDKDTPVTRYLFDDASAWVPDADSFDDYPKDGGVDVRGRSPLSTKCAADGKASGPPDIKGKNGMLYATREPSSYCVRVEKTGFVTGMALRLNPGYFVSKRFALSVPVRIAFNAGKGSMANLLIGLRGEVLFSPMDKATGVPISWFFGATYGQIQAKPPPKDPKRPAPYVMSGPLGLHTGVNVRIRVHRNFGFIVAPEVDVMLPNILLNFDVSGGVEAAF